MEQVTARRNLSNISSIGKNLHADDALWCVELVDFLGLAVFDIWNQFAIPVNQ